MFRPIAAIFRLLQFCSKIVIYMPILRGDAEDGRYWPKHVVISLLLNTIINHTTIVVFHD